MALYDNDIKLDDPDNFNEEEKTERLVFNWYTGEYEKPSLTDEEIHDKYEPVDNSSQKEECFWCGRTTVKKQLFSTHYYYCESCKK